MKKIILIVVVMSLAMIGCQNGSKIKKEQSKNPVIENTSDIQSVPPKELKTKTGKTIVINETHPVGMSISNVQIITKGFKENSAMEVGDIDPIQRVELVDLDNDGFEEIYIFTQSAGSGSGGRFHAYASDRDEKLLKIENQEVEEQEYLKGGKLEGYMGHDTFVLDNGLLIREFPVYKESDSNIKPTGGTKRVIYKLINRKLEIVKTEKN